MSKISLKSSPSLNLLSMSINSPRLTMNISSFLKAKDIALESLNSFEQLSESFELEHQNVLSSPVYHKICTNVYLLSSRPNCHYNLEEAISGISQNTMENSFKE